MITLIVADYLKTDHDLVIRPQLVVGNTLPDVDCCDSRLRTPVLKHYGKRR